MPRPDFVSVSSPLLCNSAESVPVLVVMVIMYGTFPVQAIFIVCVAVAIVNAVQSSVRQLTLG